MSRVLWNFGGGPMIISCVHVVILAVSADGVLGDMPVERFPQSGKVQVAVHPAEVAGENYHVKGIRRTFRDHGMPITSKGTTLEEVKCILVPERWNEHDPNAVAVLVGAHHVGYLPADLARHYSTGLLRLAELGTLASGLARIWAKADAGVIRARVTVLLPEATAFA